MYEGYAHLYDRSGQFRFSLRMVRYCRTLWALLGANPRSLLDLACGTGTAAIAFARQGLAVTGLDLSRGMLERAKRKKGGEKVRWVEGDLRTFVLPESFDAITCLYDSLNYLLTPEDFRRACQRAARHLKRGGTFLFDLATEHALAEEWGNSMEALASHRLFQIWHSRWDPETRLAQMDLTFFEPQDGKYRMFEETHRHRAIPPAEVKESLAKAGFRLEGRFDCFTLDSPTPETYRVVYLARRMDAPVGRDANLYNP